MNDIDVRIAAMSRIDLRDALLELTLALHEQNTDKAYAVLRDWGLEQEEDTE